ncbi:MAG TPA: DUF1801 domain-containing protein [Kofleriaceae bacterium]|nr:DUF1801 domain-containing protein [Kofleriaceae bacterium]
MTAKKKPAAKKKAPAKKKALAKKAPTPKKVEIKTRPTGASVDGFFAKQDAERRDDCKALDAMFRRVTGEDGRLWGTAIVGYGQYVYTSPTTGRSGDWMITGFSPRKQNLTIYLMDGFEKRKALLARIGKHATSKGSCLYIKRLADVNPAALEELVRQSVATMRTRHAGQA